LCLEIDTVDNDLSWITKNGGENNTKKDKPIEPISKAIIPELLTFMLQSIEQEFSGETTERKHFYTNLR
jgi:hypothetical protein